MTGWLSRLLGYCWRHRGRLSLAVGASMLGMAAAAVAPLLQKSIIDDVVVDSRRELWPLATGLLVIAAASYATAYLRRHHGGALALDIQHDLRTDIFDALSELDGKGQDELETGQIISRANSDVALVRNLLGSLPALAGNLVLFLVSLVAMVLLSPLLTVVAIVTAAAVWWIGARGRTTLFPSTWQAQQEAGEVSGVVSNAVAGVRVVTTFGQQEQEVARLTTAARRLYASRMRGIRLAAWYRARLELVPALGLVGVLALGGTLAVRGTVTLGTFLAFATYLTLLIAPVRLLTTLLTVGPQARAGAVRVFQVIDSQPRVQEAPDAVPLADDAPPEVELVGVTFAYTAGRPALRGLSLRVRPGETLAVIGRMGSGKTTLSLLLPRFYDPQEGSVRVGGHDIRELTLDSLRRHVGLVLEETFLFSGTIRDNISYGVPEATSNQVVAAAVAAEAHDFIERLPDGYDTRIGERGLTLSGGERQRVALARALLTGPQVLVLDDATSAVDAGIEAEIHATLRKVMRGRTTVLIAHRRSTLALADRVAVIDQGRLVDEGTPQELTRRCPLYRLLLSGPGEDAEGADAGELPVDEVGSPWRRDHPEPQPNPTAATSNRDHGFFALLSPSESLRRQVAALPPAQEEPSVDEATARAPSPQFRMLDQLRPLVLPLLASVVLAAANAAAALALPMLTRHGIDQGILAGSLAAIGLVSVLGLAVALAGYVTGAALTLVAGRTGERILYTLRLKTFAHLQRLGVPYHEREMSGRIVTRMTTDVDAVGTFVQDGLITAAVGALTLGGILVALVVINPELALVALCALPLLLAATVLFRSRSAPAYAEARERISTVNADLHENVTGLRVTQAYRRQRRNRGRFAQHSDAYRATRARAQRHAAWYFPLIALIADLAAVVTLVAGTRLVQAGSLTAGELIAYLLYLALLFGPVQQLSQVYDGYQQALVGARRIRELLSTASNTPPPADPTPVPPRLAGRIEFENVHLSYPAEAEHDVAALRGISLVVEPGETVAVVGRTGAGKSSLVKLVPRLYDPTAGTVRVDGVDLRDYDPTAYRHRLGTVPQETFLFPGTVRDTVAYGKPDATDAAVEAAARAVGAHEMIARLRGGYHHQVSEGGRNLSAGQRQLLALARAYLVDPDILLLDEATAALDLVTEAATGAVGQSGGQSRTTLLVAHRLTTAARADRILVMDGGRIVETGDHATLVAAGGYYADQWQAFAGAGEPWQDAAGVR